MKLYKPASLQFKLKTALCEKVVPSRPLVCRQTSLLCCFIHPFVLFCRVRLAARASTAAAFPARCSFTRRRWPRRCVILPACLYETGAAFAAVLVVTTLLRACGLAGGRVLLLERPPGLTGSASLSVRARGWLAVPGRQMGARLEGSGGGHQCGGGQRLQLDSCERMSGE